EERVTRAGAARVRDHLTHRRRLRDLDDRRESRNAVLDAGPRIDAKDVCGRRCSRRAREEQNRNQRNECAKESLAHAREPTTGRGAMLAPLDPAQNLDDRRVAAETDLVAITELALAIEADVLLVHEGAVRGARVFDLHGAGDAVDDDRRVTRGDC